ncbi:hypothetical protein COCSADRAFT_165374 [Bipolaris sorokiniana ND90Pr]|uniref:Uncharacterized protein n=1 Tax=Cochliobolus sativus (strain ND90Pr / ATCC 201652) TaxID=665912 RepID=M2SP76_COCSN|nr:uncharacterized protein COCSADRAFT_165374 [Bipolaris sorokiniana ND90Pr]EMD58552.1 hypothetical protein COCSADRAFT_165374 [Bipolaris sorokiniana ND90Pr]
MPLTPPQVESEAHESVDTISTIDPYNLLNLTVITPCSSAPNAHNLALPMLYHLLTCGHIITINHPDRRCARNCHHTIPTPSSHSSEFPEPQCAQSDDKTTFTDACTDIHTDTIYCEICTGIPFDN